MKIKLRIKLFCLDASAYAFNLLTGDKRERMFTKNTLNEEVARHHMWFTSYPVAAHPVCNMTQNVLLWGLLYSVNGRESHVWYA
jgi:hypothetical protein